MTDASVAAAAATRNTAAETRGRDVVAAVVTASGGTDALRAADCRAEAGRGQVGALSLMVAGGEPLPAPFAP
jgi:hypothetical protein